MRNNIITIISMYCILMSSCQEDQKNHTYQQKTSETNINQESYLYEENKDTILLSLAKTENSISGKIKYITGIIHLNQSCIYLHFMIDFWITYQYRFW